MVDDALHPTTVHRMARGVLKILQLLLLVKIKFSVCSFVPFHASWWSKFGLDSIDCVKLKPQTSAQPFVCHDDFLDYCDIAFTPGKELTTFQGIKIFLYATDIAAFSNISRSITDPFILITRSNWDEVVPYQHSNHQTELLAAYTSIIEHPRLVRWFASNVVIQHPNLVSMPLGPKWQWHTQAMHGEDNTKGALLKVFGQYALDTNSNFYSKPKTGLLFTTMSEHSSDGAAYAPWRGNRRVAARALRQNFPLNTMLNSSFHPTDFVSTGECAVRRDSELYLLNLRNYQFVLSPPGNGPDCHRTWEALLMGCIPVVITGPFDKLYDGLPVLILKSWDDLTPMHLIMAYKRFRYGHHRFAFEKLFTPYWLDLIDKAKQEALSRI